MKQFAKGRRSGLHLGWLVGLLVLTTPASSVLSSQASRQKPPVFTGGVDLVVQDVTVVDRDGRPIRGLTAADFTVREDGRAVAVASLVEVRVPDADPAPAAWMREVAHDVRWNARAATGRLVVLVMDDASNVYVPLAPAAAEYAKRTAREIVEGLGAADLAAVVFPGASAPPQDFTADRARLLAAIDRYSPNINGSLRHYQALVSTLRMLASSLGDVTDRRKSVYLLSPGIPIDFAAAAPKILDSCVLVSEQNHVRDLVWEMQETFRHAQRAHLNVHGIELHGEQFGGRAFTLRREFLQTMAENTGGTAIVNARDAVPGVRRTLQESGSYYLLGYAPTNDRREGRFRRVQIAVNRPGATVRTRSGYDEPLAPGRRAPTPVLQRVLSGTLPDPGVPLAVAVAPFANGRDGAVAIALRVQHDAPVRRTIEQVDVVTRAFSLEGDPRGSSRQTARVVLAPAGDVPGRYEVLTRIDLRPGRYTLRFGVHNRERDLGGSVYADVHVPDFTNAPLSLSGIVLSASPAPRAAPAEALAPLLPVVPTTFRDFTAAHDVSAFVRIYQGGRRALQPAEVEAVVTDQEGRETMVAAARIEPEGFGRHRAADYAVTLPLARLDPGPYLLTIRAAAGEQAARGHVRFSLW